jgi:hypothetical protein
VRRAGFVRSFVRILASAVLRRRADLDGAARRRGGARLGGADLDDASDDKVWARAAGLRSRSGEGRRGEEAARAPAVECHVVAARCGEEEDLRPKRLRQMRVKRLCQVHDVRPRAPQRPPRARRARARARARARRA